MIESACTHGQRPPCWPSSQHSHPALLHTDATCGPSTDTNPTHRPMKNKAGTAAGNPRARADRASPTMNGNPNAQVRPSVLMFTFTTAIGIFCIHFTLFSFPLSVQHSPIFHPVRFFPHGCTGCVLFCTCRIPRAGAGARCQGWQPSFGFRPSGPGPAQVQMQWVAGPPVADPTLPPAFSEVWASHPCSSHHWTQRHAFPASMSHNCLCSGCPK